MKITADTNILVRTVVNDDAEQAAAARKLLLHATIIAVPVPVFCEIAWVGRVGARLDGIARRAARAHGRRGTLLRL